MSNWNETIQKMLANPEIVQPNVVHGRTEEYPMPQQQIPKEAKMPIYNDPNHPDYGPCRRLHLILLYLYTDNLPEFAEGFRRLHQIDWTEFLSQWLAKGLAEATGARAILFRFSLIDDGRR